GGHGVGECGAHLTRFEHDESPRLRPVRRWCPTRRRDRAFYHLLRDWIGPKRTDRTAPLDRAEQVIRTPIRYPVRRIRLLSLPPLQAKCREPNLRSLL